MADYFQHWFDMGDRLGEKAPRIFYVHWFRKSTAGEWLWPGYGENSRVLKWMCDRVDGKLGARYSPIGLLPNQDDLDLSWLNIPEEQVRQLLSVDRDEWKEEAADIVDFLILFGDRLPERLRRQLHELERRLAEPEQVAGQRAA